MSGPQYNNGQVVGGAIQITYSRTGVSVVGAAGDTGEDVITTIGGPKGYKGRLLALFVVTQVDVNNPLSLGIVDVNDGEYMPLTVIGDSGFTNADDVDFMNQATVDACREFSGETQGNNDSFKIYADATGAGTGVVDIHAVVEWVPGEVSVIPDEGEGGGGGGG